MRHLSLSHKCVCTLLSLTLSLSIPSLLSVSFASLSLSFFSFLRRHFNEKICLWGLFITSFLSLSLLLTKLTILCTTNTTIAKKGSTLHNWNFWGSVNCRWWPLFYNFDFSTEFSKIKLFMTWCELQTFDVGRGHLSKWRYHNDCLWTFYSHWPPLLNAVY